MARHRRDELVTVFTGPSVQAGMVRELLESQGVRAFTANYFMAAIAPFLSSESIEVRVMVAGADVAKAKEIIDVYFEGQAEVPAAAGRLSPHESSVARPKVPHMVRVGLRIAIATIVLVFAGTLVHEHFFVKYYRRLESLGNGELRGRYQLSKAQAARTDAYRVTLGFDGRPHSIEYEWQGYPEVDSDGILGVKRVDIAYSRHSQTRTFSNGAGRSPVNARGVFGERIDFDADGAVVSVTSLDGEGNPMEDKSGIARVDRSTGRVGGEFVNAFFNRGGLRVADAHGNYETHYKRDAAGRISEFETFNTDGRPLANAHGVAKFIYAYDAAGNRVETQSFGANGKPVGGVRSEYDAGGNVLRSRFVDSNDRPVEDAGCAVWKRQYNEDGNIVAKECIGSDGKLRDLGGVATARWEYQRGNGWLFQFTSFDKNGKVVKSKNYAVRPHRGDLSAGPSARDLGFTP